MYRGALIITLLFSLSVASAEKYTRVMTWNIAAFWPTPGEPLWHDSVIRIASDYEAIRRVIADTGADIIGLQEMASPDAARILFPVKDWALIFEGRFYEDLSSGRVNLRRRDKRDIYTAIAIRRTSAKVLKTERIQALRFALPQSDGRTHHTREGIAAKLKIGQQHIWVASVHLKSFCHNHIGLFPVVSDTPASGPSKPPAKLSKACDVLAKQVPALEEWMDLKLRSGQQVILLGDFNRALGKKDDEVAAQLDDGEPDDLFLTPFRKATRCDAASPKARIGVDYIIISEGLRRMAVTNHPHAMYNIVSRKISDHCPVWLDIDFKKR